MRRILRKLLQIVIFLIHFAWDLLMANLRLARQVVRPLHELRPAILAIPLDLNTNVQITVLANLITLTPGTLSVDVSSDRKVLYVHTISGSEPDRARAQIKSGIERRVKELLS